MKKPTIVEQAQEIQGMTQNAMRVFDSTDRAQRYFRDIAGKLALLIASVERAKHSAETQIAHALTVVPEEVKSKKKETR